MRFRTWKLLVCACVSGLGTAALAGCQTDPFAPPPPLAAQVPAPVEQGVRIAALLPLSGPNASLGHSMLNAIRLALAHSKAALDVDDTSGTSLGAAHAATQAVTAHDDIILGPLTSAETRAAASVASPAGIPILAYTSDLGEARAGVWVLGIAPEQQVTRLVAAARSDNHTKFAAFLPNGAFGDAMAAALAQAVPGSDVRRHDTSFRSINDGLKSLSDFDVRQGNRDTQVKADRASTDPVIKAQADALAATPVPPAPFDALLLADTGTELQEIIDLLGPYDIPPGQVRILGPSLWGKFARKLGPIAGAWYAAPDPAARTGFVDAYDARFHTAPNGLDDFAYDSAALAGALAANGGFSPEALTRADGFAGTDGVFALSPNGHVRRGLAVFQIDAGGGSHIAIPAPRVLGPSSDANPGANPGAGAPGGV